jgi:uncharacterized protein involved in exopolysaccharide biosynthesis
MKQIFDISDQAQFRAYTVKDIVSIVFKYKTMILLTTIIVAVTATAGIFYLPRTYEMTGKILIRMELQGSPSFFTGVASYRERVQDDPAKPRIETEMAIVESRPIAEEVVRSLNLNYDQVYHSPLTHFLRPISDHIVDPVLGAIGFPPDPLNRGFQDTVTEFSKGVRVQFAASKSGDTSPNVIMVALKAPDAEIAQRALQKLLETYQQYDVGINREISKTAYEIVKTRMQESLKELKSSRLDLREFEATEKVYFDLKNRLSQIEVYMDMNERHAGSRIIMEPAQLPRESSLKKDVMLCVFGSFMGLAFGLMLAGLRELLDHTLDSKEDVEKELGLENLGKFFLEKNEAPSSGNQPKERPLKISSLWHRIRNLKSS